ncbi:MAG: RNA 3'-terminal phosphate cyclase [Candidatus Acidiferrales bacterium]
MLQTKSSLSIDGSIGEGGGQVLRTSLALALITGRAFTLNNIRQRRVKPGLMAQHLKAVEAAREVGKATVEGARLGSQSLVFEPTGLCSGEFHFDIGTAGSTSLVLQTILPPLSFATASSVVTLIGGTHVPWSPCFHYLEMHWLHYMRRIGFDIRLELGAAGFYPRGGGRVLATVGSASRLSPLCLTNRGPLKRIRGISAVANLDLGIAERQKARALNELNGMAGPIEIEILRLSSPSKGTLLLLLAEFENSQCCFCGLGALRKPAERVADEAVNELLGFMATDGAIDHYLSDQLILPLALAPGVSEISTSKVTQHLTTNAEIVKMFLPVSIEVDGQIGQPGTIRITHTE